MGNAEKSKESWQERSKSIKTTWTMPFVFVEWICEQILYDMEHSAFIKILGYAGRFTILIAVIVYFFMEVYERRITSENQRKAKHYQAWQVINTAQGKSGSGGRKNALEDLNKENVDLEGIKLYSAYLNELNLSGANLTMANFSGAYLDRADLSGAQLDRADLSGSYLNLANLSGARLFNADLHGAILISANLSEANLSSADLHGADLNMSELSGAMLCQVDLTGARLVNADLPGADLRGAKLSGTKLLYADFSGANLAKANFSWADLNGADLAEAQLFGANFSDIHDWQKIKNIELANIYGVKNPPEGFIEWAKEHGAVSIENKYEWKDLIYKKKKEDKKQEAEKTIKR